MNFELDVTGNSGFLQQGLRDSYALGITDLNDLGFHNYFVITLQMTFQINC